jgi:hypothetical protein
MTAKRASRVSPSALSRRAVRFSRVFAAVSIGALSGLSICDHALAWGSGGSGGGGAGGAGGPATSGRIPALAPQPVMLTDADRDNLNRALADANLVKRTRLRSPAKDVLAIEADMQKILADLAGKGYDSDPEYMLKLQQINDAIKEGGPPAAPNTM